MTAGLTLTDCQMSHDLLGGGHRHEVSVYLTLTPAAGGTGTVGVGAAHGCLRVALQQSSVCGAALHSGVIDNHGGWLDVTRLGRKQPFLKSYRNGIQSLGYVWI